MYMNLGKQIIITLFYSWMKQSSNEMIVSAKFPVLLIQKIFSDSGRS